MINISLDELKLVAKNRGIKDYENKSEEDLIKILSESKPKINIPKKKLKEIKKILANQDINFLNQKLTSLGKVFMTQITIKIFLQQK